MTEHSNPIHIYFFPLMTPSHMIPLVDMARKFARHDTKNVKVTIVVPHHNAPQFRARIEPDRQQGSDINIRQVTFPNAQVGLPDDCISLASLTSPELHSQFNQAIQLLRAPAEQLLKEDRPDFIVSDFFIPWTAALAIDLQIPRILFHVTCFFSLCVHHSLMKHKPHKGVESDSDTFVVPELPDVVKTTRGQLINFLRDGHEDSHGIVENSRKAAEMASYGFVFNSFYELEPEYVEYYKINIAPKAWHLGPVSLGNINHTKMVKGEYCLDWLSTKEPNSVVYACFGTMSLFSAAQLREIAVGLESCGRDFIWVVRSGGNEDEWLPEGFEERVRGRGLVIRSWAPQVLILEHESVGGFLTHCGWNSVLEGVTAGKPMITWPITADHFEIDKLVTHVLRIGVGVGCMEWRDWLDVGRDLIVGESIAKAVNQVMVGEEGVEMRIKAKALSDKAKKAVEKGGSSYNDLDSLLEELKLNKYGKI